MRKILFRSTIIILSIILVIALGLGVIYATKISKLVKQYEMEKDTEKAQYHVMVIVDGFNTAYSDEFKQGMIEASRKYNTAVEFWEIRENNTIEKTLEKFDIAINSSVDGIIVHAFNNELFEEYIKKAHNKDIPVIMLNEDIVESERISYIGINKFRIGSEVGQLIKKAVNGEGNIAIIEKNIYDKNDSAKDALISMGLHDAIKDDEDLKIETLEYSGDGLLSAEAVTMDILINHKDVNIIFCDNGQDTLSVIQVLIDFNKIQDMTIIGYDDMPEILSYIERGLIYATIVSDYKEIGYSVIETFAEYKSEEMVSEYINADIQIITKENIERYRTEIEMSEDHEEN